MARCTPVAAHNPSTNGIRASQCSDRRRASAMRLTSSAPRYTAIGGMAALNMPSSEYRTSDLGEAAHANARPCRRFFRTRCARPFAGSELPLMGMSGRLPQKLQASEVRPVAPPIGTLGPQRHRRHGRLGRVGTPFVAAFLAAQLDDDDAGPVAGPGREGPTRLILTLRTAMRVRRLRRWCAHIQLPWNESKVTPTPTDWNQEKGEGRLASPSLERTR